MSLLTSFMSDTKGISIVFETEKKADHVITDIMSIIISRKAFNFNNHLNYCLVKFKIQLF